MVTYIVASKSNQPYLAECQILGEFLEAKCPDVSVKIVIKHQTEWNDFLDNTCRSYGFYEKTCPLIYTIEGRLVGDGASFVEEIREKYGKVLAMSKEVQKKRTHENMTMINDEMRKKEEGLTLGEKISKQLEKVKSKKVATHISSAFYQPEIDRESMFFVRRVDQFTGDVAQGRFHHVEDEKAIAAKI
jgi:hypothetical protein